MKKHFSFAFMLLIVSCCFTLTAFGQETTGSLEITTRDPNGAAVPNVAVTITSATTGTTGFRRTATTADDGFVRVLQVPPGTYNVSAAATAGFVEKTIPNIQVSLGKATQVIVDLGITATGNVEVTAGDALAIDTTDSKIQTNISAQMAELLPKGTNFASILKISPATRPEPRSGQFQIDGASGSENTFVIDGQEVTNVRTGVLDANSNLPFQLVQEVQVKSSGFEAEYGGATGGVVNVVTKGGSNSLRGEFGVNVRHSDLEPRGRQILFLRQGVADYFRPGRDDYREFNPSLNLGGPIVKDRLWFFGSYTPQYFHQERTLSYVNASDEVTPTFPTQTYHQRQVNDYSFLRLDAQPFDKLRLTGAYTYNPIALRGGIPGWTTQYFTPSSSSPAPVFQAGNTAFRGAPYLDQTGGRQNSQSVSFQATYTPTNNLIFSGRGGHYFLNEKLGAYGYGDVTQPSVLCSSSSRPAAPANPFPPGFGCASRGQQLGSAAFDGTLFDATKRNTLDFDTTFLTDAAGRHEFKGGFQRNAIGNSVITRFSDQIVYRFGWTVAEYSGNAQLPSTPGAIGAGLLQIFETQGSVSSSNLGLYFQDKWQPTKRLTLNLGFRTEREDVPSFTEGLPGIRFDFQDKIAPRLGVSYDLFGDGKTKIWGFYGWFYDRFKYELPRGSFGGDLFHTVYFEILPGDTAASLNSRAEIIGAGTFIPGGACPTNTTTPVYGRVRCDKDSRIQSNAGLPLTVGGGIDPDIKAFRQSEFTAGFERELGGNFVLSSRYTHKNVDHAVEDAGFPNAAGSEYYIIGNPGEGLYKKTAESFGLQALKPVRRYDAVEVSLNRRFANNFYFNANYTWSRLFGNYSGLASSDEEGRLAPNVNRYFDQPQVGWTAAGGPDNGLLNTDRTHVFKFYGAYSLDWKERFGTASDMSTEFQVFTSIQSGTPLTSMATVNDIEVVLTKRGDMGRTPVSSSTDFAIRHRVRFGHDNRFTIVGETDILNLFNTATPTNYGTIISQNVTYDVREALTDAQNAACSTSGNQVPCYNAGYKLFQQNGAPSFVTEASAQANQYTTYNKASDFQGRRQVRFGLRFIF
ncbi:MAG TPA: TonB-dependent receptor [Pyrinomonadaceae bacterium]|nr:TonB-dependent receptor [Pyrinomonadaceae bacterium]